jgi:hypothetical protein
MAISYIRISPGVFVEYDNTQDEAKIIHRADVVNLLQMAKDNLKKFDLENPTTLSNTQLLEWARANYPFVNLSEQHNKLQAEVDRLTILRDSLVAAVG